MPIFNSSRALELLRAGTQNPTAVFREGQEEAIRHIVEARGRLLVVQKTGWGKSAVYFISAKMLREQGAGPALLISPLLSLMRNQIAAAARMGVQAYTIHSENESEWPAIEFALRANQADILLISPERLANERFRVQLLSPIAAQIALLVVDEAHCISDWGHDFRPHYRLLERIIRTLPSNLRLLATTATANNRVTEDLGAVLGPNLTLSKGDLSRRSLFLQTITMPGQAERLAWIGEQLPLIPGSGIVYTLTKRDAVEVARWLRSRGLAVEAYTSEAGERRAELEDALLDNRLKALVATTALGMGFDKPDLAFVIHYQAPGSVVAYYQQVGRAGRAVPAAYGILLSGHEETQINDYFIDSAFPSREEVTLVLRALESSRNGLSIAELQQAVNVSKGRIDKVLLLLSLESPAPITKQGTKWMLTIAELPDSFWSRADRLTTLRRAELRQMQNYVALSEGHMEYLIDALDGEKRTFVPPDCPCLPSTSSPVLAQEAVAFLRRTSFPLEPRKQWPTGGLAETGVSGRIAQAHQPQAGKILCVWGDSGWGFLVKKGKYHDGLFSDELVAACVELVRNWSPRPDPTWVTCIPSNRHPALVPDFARRLAISLDLPFYTVLEKVGDHPPQKTMANSTQQARNVDGAFRISSETLPDGPVLLVDDMVDSRWTLTVAAYLLLSAGSGAVHPLALASAAHTEE